MIWYEMVHKINTNLADEYLKANNTFEKAALQKTQEAMYRLLEIETLARIATALEKLADCNIDIYSEDYLEDSN